MLNILEDTAPRGDEIRLAFARAARVALLGLLAAPALLGLASAAGHPLRAAAGPAYWVCALAGFGGAGWFAARSLGARPDRSRQLAGAFLVAGLLVTPAIHELQGLTGRESLVAVAAAVLPAFGAAFALAGILAARSLAIIRLNPRGVLSCAAAGVVGGAFAMLPFCWAWLRLDVPGEAYLVMTLAVVGFLGSLIAPFHIVGAALDRARDQAGLARA